MAALSNPVNAINVVSRFIDYLYTARTGVTWGTNDLPVYAPGTPYAVTVITAASMGGPNYGDPGAGAFIGNAVPGAVINAYDIFNYLNLFTYEYCYIRNIRALLTVTGAGGNIGTQPVAGDVYDVTRVGYVNFRNTQAGRVADYVTPVSGGVAGNQIISAVEMENFLSRCRAAYNNFARNQTYLWNPIICHSSCHASCHGARGRR